MFDLDFTTNENNKEHNENWPYISDHPYKLLIIGGCGSAKTNVLLNLINNKIVTFLLRRFICLLKTAFD